MQGGGGARTTGLPSAHTTWAAAPKGGLAGARDKVCPGYAQSQDPPGAWVLNNDAEMMCSIKINRYNTQLSGVFYIAFSISHFQARLTFQNLTPNPRVRASVFLSSTGLSLEGTSLCFFFCGVSKAHHLPTRQFPGNGTQLGICKAFVIYLWDPGCPSVPTGLLGKEEPGQTLKKGDGGNIKISIQNFLNADYIFLN